MAALVERNQVGKREDLRDAITFADRKKTPFTSSVKKGTRPQNVLMEWNVDNNPEPRIEGVVDEEDATDFENFAAGRKQLQNRIMISERKPRVSRLAEEVSNVAGVGPRQEMAKSIAKSIVMLKRDIEFRSLGDDEAQVDDGNVGNETRGFGKWIQTTAQTIYPVDADYRPAAAQVDVATTLANFKDDTIIDVMQAIYDVTGDDDSLIHVYCGSIFKRAVSKLSVYTKTETGFEVARRFNATAGKTITQSVDVMETDFGKAMLRLSAFINTGGDHKTTASKKLAYFLDMDLVELRFAKNPSFASLENQGGGPRGISEAYWGTVATNPKPLGKIALQ